MDKQYVIGVLGGMGTYATIHLFNQYAKVFPAAKEWDRPRIIIDNRCTMPSRVRAFLYKENVDKLIDEMSDSMTGLFKAGCNRIILACNTSHLFLPEIFKKEPALKDCVVNIIENCVAKIESDKVKKVFLLGSEGTIDSKVYQTELEKLGIKCIVPDNTEYFKLRELIEAVKQNRFSAKVKNTFCELVNRYENCILGCTELPVLYEKYKKSVNLKNVYDPVLITLLKIKGEFIND